MANKEADKKATTPYDAVDYLRTDEDSAAYLNVATEDGDPQLFAAALDDVVRAKGGVQAVRETNTGR